MSTGGTVSHHKSGGSAGWRGSDGRGGRRGPPGCAAEPGSYHIRVVAGPQPGAAVLAVAPERYNVVIVGFEPVGSEDGILEPGEEFAVRSLTLFNNGSLPTPLPHCVVIAVAPSEWIELVGDPSRIPVAILPGHTLLLDHLPPLRFRVRHNFPLTPNVIPVATPRISFDTWVSRVNKRFRQPDQAEGCALEVRRTELMPWTLLL